MRSINNANPTAKIESLESRTFLSATAVYDGQASLTINGTGGNDHIDVSCQDLQTDHDYSVRVWQVLLNGKNYQFATNFIYYLTINGRGGSDQISIFGQFTGSKAYVNTSGGTSTLSLTEMNGGARLDFHGGGQDTLHYEGPWMQPIGDFTLTGTAIHWNSADRLTFSGVQNLDFVGSANPDKINVNYVPYNMNFNVDGQQDNDIISVGNGDIAHNIRGHLHIDGGSKYPFSKGTDTLVFDDTNSLGGIDTLDYSSFSMFGLSNPITWTAIERVTLNGSNNDDYINVNTAAEQLLTIHGNGGNDVINLGGSGWSGTLDYVQMAKISIDGGAGVDVVTANDQFTGGPADYAILANAFKFGISPGWTTANIERLNLYTAGGNTHVNGLYAGESLGIYCSGASDTVYGSAHNDSIYGGAGNDLLLGMAGDDFIDGGTGSDYMSGGVGWDTISYQTRTKALFINLNKFNGQGETGENDSIFNDFEVIQGGQGNDTITLNVNTSAWVYGNNGNDTLIGSNQPDALIGGAGNDLIKGNAGNDLLMGGDGNDKIAGGAGNDTLFAQDGLKDTLDGGAGTNTILKDVLDVIQAIV